MAEDRLPKRQGERVPARHAPRQDAGRFVADEPDIRPRGEKDIVYPDA